MLFCVFACPSFLFSWPRPGYYSTTESQYSPVPCLLPSACSGVDPVVGSAPGFVFDPAATCNRGNGFTGYLCSQCDSNHYAVEQTCRSCELDAASRQTLIATVIAAVCLFALLALGVAFMSDAKLVFFVTVIVLIQQCSFVGAVAASRFTSGGASDFFAVLGLLNFEITIFKLGCRVPQISVLTVLWYTVLFLLGAGVLLILASALYAVTRRAQIRRVQSAPSKKPQPEQLDAPLQIRSDSESAITHNPAASMHESVDLAADPSSGVRDSSASLPPLQAQPSALTRLDSTLGPTAPTRRMKVWKRRAQNSLTVLGVVIYLQLSSQILRCLFCVKIEGVLVLQVEPTTGQWSRVQRCLSFPWSGSHSLSSVVLCVCQSATSAVTAMPRSSCGPPCFCSAAASQHGASMLSCARANSTCGLLRPPKTSTSIGTSKSDGFGQCNEETRTANVSCYSSRRLCALCPFLCV